jgi:hypothetical protein
MNLHFKTLLQYNVNLHCIITDHKGLERKLREISYYIQRRGEYVDTFPLAIYAINWTKMFMYINK